MQGSICSANGAAGSATSTLDDSIALVRRGKAVVRDVWLLLAPGCRGIGLSAEIAFMARSRHDRRIWRDVARPGGELMAGWSPDTHQIAHTARALAARRRV